MPPFHNRRRRLRAMEEAEASGESFFTTRFNEPVRRKIHYALTRLSGGTNSVEAVVERAGAAICEDEGWGSLFVTNTGVVNAHNYYFLCDDDEFPTVVEAIYYVLADGYIGVPPQFENETNEILREYRVLYELINGEMVEKDSQELHAEVIAPMLRLLSGRPSWESVESAYQKALTEIHEGDPADAITDAATALQEALKARGSRGGSLGQLANDARTRGLLAAHDQTLIRGLETIIDWVEADRTAKGDVHNADPALRDDAWLTTHIAGALILRLAGERRGASPADRVIQCASCGEELEPEQSPCPFCGSIDREIHASETASTIDARGGVD